MLRSYLIFLITSSFGFLKSWKLKNFWFWFFDNPSKNHDAVRDTFVAIEQDVGFHAG
jgi:hypothetical protein